MAKIATVFSASARTGMEQVKALRKAGYHVRAVSRGAHPGFTGCVLLSASCLAPDIVTAIVEGRQPETLSASMLLASEPPLQRKLLQVA